MTARSLVLETNNLEGGAGDVVPGLERLLLRLREQTLPLADLADVVITHHGLAAADRVRGEQAAGVPITWVELPAGTPYYEAKNRGFDAARGDIVVFGDSDCWPDRGWLAALLAPFERAGVQVVAGRTTYRDDLLGIAATTIDFMYFEPELGRTRNFYANNVAFRRGVFGARRYGDHALYRGHCTVLGMDLYAAGVPVVFEPRARTIHRFPDSLRELVQLRLMRGRDTYELTPRLIGSAVREGLRPPRLGPVTPLAVLGARLGFSLRSINRQDMPPVRGLAHLAVIGTIAAITAVDAVGAAAGGLRLIAAQPRAALSYHRADARIAA